MDGSSTTIKNESADATFMLLLQSQSKTEKVQSRMFYFTEVDGRIYNVATNSPVERAERLAEESEKIKLNSLQSRIRPAQRASVRNKHCANVSRRVSNHN